MKQFLVGVILGILIASPSFAQMGMGSGGTYKLEDGERNLKFAGIPVPGYSNVLGFNLGLVGMVYYKLDRHDDLCPPSSSGVFGYYSENKSWLGAAFSKFHYKEDRWRSTVAFGTGSFKYQFNTESIGPGLPDIFLDYTTAAKFVVAKGSNRVWEKLYLGLGILSWSSAVAVDPELIETPEERYTGPVIDGEWDARDHIFFPTAGYHLSAQYDIYTDALGSDRNFQDLKLAITGYQALGDSTRVLAGRLMSQTASGDVPFSGQSILSGQRNLRGYSSGRYRGNNLIVAETEYRWNVFRRWGVVAFVGAGWVASEMSDMKMDETRPAAGFGFRFRMIEEYRINARIDFGWGEDDQGIYFSIGEAY